MRHAILKAIVVLSGVGISACASAQPPEPARFTNPDSATLAKVTARLSEALGRSRIELGAMDFANTTTVSVLPPPVDALDGRSPARPELFDVVLHNGRCALIARSDGRMIPLDAVACTPFSIRK
jgi:hypothetical protein